MFPTIVYRCPGSHHCPGGTFNFTGVVDQAALDAALDEGWSLTMPEAIEKAYGTKESAPTLESVTSQLEVLGDDEPPTRAEIEKQAAELGIKFKKTTSDEELLKKIDEALEG